MASIIGIVLMTATAALGIFLVYKANLWDETTRKTYFIRIGVAWVVALALKLLKILLLFANLVTLFAFCLFATYLISREILKRKKGSKKSEPGKKRRKKL